MASQFSLPFITARELSAFDPFEVTQEVGRLFGNFFPTPGSLMGLPARASDLVSWPRLDVHEDEHHIHVEAELPGVDAEDVEVRIEGDTLLISGEKRAHRRQVAASYHVMERSFGHFKRSISLPFTLDARDVEADFSLGVLSIRVPRQPPRETSRRIEVRQGPVGKGTPPGSYLQDEQRMPAGPDSQGIKAGDEPAH